MSMRLSRLQKYILDVCFDRRYAKIERAIFLKYYSHFAKKAQKQDQISAITKSLERLIKNGIVIGYGEITQNKIYIEKIRLTPIGRKLIKKILGEQKKLPL